MVAPTLVLAVPLVLVDLDVGVWVFCRQQCEEDVKQEYQCESLVMCTVQSTDLCQTCLRVWTKETLGHDNCRLS